MAASLRLPATLSLSTIIILSCKIFQERVKMHTESSGLGFQIRTSPGVEVKDSVRTFDSLLQDLAGQINNRRKRKRRRQP